MTAPKDINFGMHIEITAKNIVRHKNLYYIDMMGHTRSRRGHYRSLKVKNLKTTSKNPVFCMHAQISNRKDKDNVEIIPKKDCRGAIRLESEKMSLLLTARLSKVIS